MLWGCGGMGRCLIEVLFILGFMGRKEGMRLMDMNRWGRLLFDGTGCKHSLLED